MQHLDYSWLFNYHLQLSQFQKYSSANPKMAPQLGEQILGLPVEIQDQIFAPCLDRGRWRGVDSDLVPDLLVACRGDEGLYRRLLKIYYAVNSFCIDPRSIHVLNNLKPETTALMVHLEMLVYGYSLENR
jgi:hypothetical protein